MENLCFSRVSARGGAAELTVAVVGGRGGAAPRFQDPAPKPQTTLMQTLRSCPVYRGGDRGSEGPRSSGKVAVSGEVRLPVSRVAALGLAGCRCAPVCLLVT